VKEIEAALADAGPKAERSLAMKKESWEGRVEEVRGHVASLRPRR
jgi:hypothetical protein